MLLHRCCALNYFNVRVLCILMVKDKCQVGFASKVSLLGIVRIVYFDLTLIWLIRNVRTGSTWRAITEIDK